MAHEIVGLFYYRFTSRVYLPAGELICPSTPWRKKALYLFVELMDETYISNAHKNKITLLIYYFLHVPIVVATVLFIWQGDYASAFSTTLIFLLMFVPYHFKRRHRLYLPFTLELGIVAFIFITLFLGHIRNFYEWVPLWDKFVHFQSGLLLGVTGYVLVYILNEEKTVKLDLTPGFVSVFAVAFSLAIGAAWEIVEFAGDYAFGVHWQSSLSDTMWDLIANFIGALITSILGYFWMRHHKRLPFTPRLLMLFKKLKKKHLSKTAA